MVEWVLPNMKKNSAKKAVERMLPRGPWGRRQLGNLHVYKGPDHPHAAQTPTPFDVAKLNAKNSRSV